MSTTQTKRYTPAEELANSLTHGLGVLLAIAALALLVTLAALAGDALRVVAFTVYGTSLVLLYLASTCYHALTNPKLKRLFRILDHAAIYLLIAGTYTPITLVTLEGAWGWAIFGVIWGLALVGVVSTIFFVDSPKALTVGVYVAMGWLIIIAGKPMLAAMAPGGIAWLIAGGVAYTGGALFYGLKRLPFNHAIWHLFVLGGSVCHFFAILLYVLPSR